MDWVERGFLLLQSFCNTPCNTVVITRHTCQGDNVKCHLKPLNALPNHKVPLRVKMIITFELDYAFSHVVKIVWDWLGWTKPRFSLYPLEVNMLGSGKLFINNSWLFSSIFRRSLFYWCPAWKTAFTETAATMIYFPGLLCFLIFYLNSVWISCTADSGQTTCSS